MTRNIKQAFFLLLLVSITGLSCKKEIKPESLPEDIPSKANNAGVQGHLQQTKTFSSDVIMRWLNMQLDLLRVPLASGAGSQTADRAQGYCGIAAYEAVVNGMPAYRSLSGQLTVFPDMPAVEPGKAYHWAASANAALAEMNRKLFPTASDANKAAINNLETTLQNMYAAEVNASTLERSIAFGKEVATRIFAWAATDGQSNPNPAYEPPVGFGKWVKTSPAAPAANAYYFQRRLLVPDVAAGTEIPAPPPYSITPGSDFWNMVKDVYDKSFVLTADQIASAIYNRDNPGYPGGGHFVSIFLQALSKAQLPLDAAALAYAKVGLAQHDATIICFTNKYIHLTVRPITYIRNVMGHTTWNTIIPTPNHPEFPSGHATINSAVMDMLTNVFGDHFALTLHTYDYLGFSARSFASFEEMSIEMANSRIYGGIHYQSTCDNSRIQGKKVAQNILQTIQFLKDDD
ncbi:phosphatase PAP2 family protein [Lacibacter luteus]|uniref:Phosphatase PAP2 family protein n=1 Tax=Lacibacter luteus TaxID=2508719 RepID=A0A4Q1CHL3_9BACT|nr:vanadium-dependent haloperoxidase [Lacibacter luteus]RXK59406.1 phosphatase PAP2 family protein [Lacibacter luteus]